MYRQDGYTGTCYGEAKCAEITFERGKMLRGKVLQLLNERKKSMHENKIYKFFGVEHTDGIKMEELHNKVNEEISRRMNITTRAELHDKNQATPVTAYPMNVCQSKKSKLTELNQVTKRDLRKNKMFRRQASDERFIREKER